MSLKLILIKAMILLGVAFALGACVALFTSESFACPGFLKTSKLKPLPQGSREDVRLFTLDYVDGKRTWKSPAIQVDALDENGLLKTSREDINQYAEKMHKDDRLSFRVEKFGIRYSDRDAPPCNTKTLYELQNPNTSSKFAYIAICNGIGPLNIEPPVRIFEETQKISSPQFEYDYLPNNQLMYKTMFVKDPETNSSIAAAFNSNILLHLNIKKFFTLNLTNDSVVSYVENSHTGPLGMVSKVQFFLKMLAMKIKLKMATSASFYSDSAHLPMDIEVPVHAENFLHPDSGMTFDWTGSAATFDQTQPERTMPNADAEEIKKGMDNLVKIGLKYCKKNKPMCTYRLKGSIEDKHFRIDVNVPKPLVLRGYFPMWAKSLKQLKIDLDWDEEPKDPDNRHALFFSNATLPKGVYRMEQWIRLAKNSGPSTCPHPVAYRGSIELPKTKTPISH